MKQIILISLLLLITLSLFSYKLGIHCKMITTNIPTFKKAVYVAETARNSLAAKFLKSGDLIIGGNALTVSFSIPKSQQTSYKEDHTNTLITSKKISSRKVDYNSYSKYALNNFEHFQALVDGIATGMGFLLVIRNNQCYKFEFDF